MGRLVKKELVKVFREGWCEGKSATVILVCFLRDTCGVNGCGCTKKDLSVEGGEGHSLQG